MGIEHGSRSTLFAAVLLLAACGGTGGVQQSGQTPPPTSPTNSAPTISMPAAAEVLVGRELSVTPSASDPDGQTLTFSVSNKPAWLSFNASNGRLVGTPTAADVGSYQSVRVTVSDGAASASAQTNITVMQQTVGRATLSWQAPTDRTDGSPLTNLAGFRIYYGTNQSDLRQSVEIRDPGANTWVIENLTAGTWYFAATAFDASGVESARTNAVTKSIG